MLPLLREQDAKGLGGGIRAHVVDGAVQEMPDNLRDL